VVQNKTAGMLNINLKPGEEYIIVYRQTELKCEAAFSFAISTPNDPKAGPGGKGRGAPIGSGMMAKASANLGSLGMSYADF